MLEQCDSGSSVARYLQDLLKQMLYANFLFIVVRRYEMEVNLHAVFFIYLLTSSLRDIPRVLCLQLMEVSVALERSELSVNPVQVT